MEYVRYKDQLYRAVDGLFDFKPAEWLKRIDSQIAKVDFSISELKKDLATLEKIKSELNLALKSANKNDEKSTLNGYENAVKLNKSLNSGSYIKTLV